MSDFKTFMNLTNVNTAEEIIEILKSNKIDFKVQDTAKDFDASFANNQAKNSILIMLNPNDFEKASSVLEYNTQFDITEIEPNHPLFLYSTEELKDVVKNYEEWHPIDIKLAKYLLNEQGIIVDESEIKKHQDFKKLKSNESEKSNFYTLVIGYLFCITGGFLGIGIALFLLTAKKKLPDGTKKFIYEYSDRKHGFYMLLLGGIIFTLLLKYKL